MPDYQIFLLLFLNLISNWFRKQEEPIPIPSFSILKKIFTQRIVFLKIMSIFATQFGEKPSCHIIK